MHKTVAVASTNFPSTGLVGRRPGSRLAAITAVTLTLAAGRSYGQTRWIPRAALMPQVAHAMVYDDAWQRSSFPLLARPTLAIECARGLPNSILILPPVANAGRHGLRVDPTTLLIAPYGILDANGQASVPLPIPGDAALAGLRLFAQGVVADPSASLGLVLTQALGLTIGD